MVSQNTEDPGLNRRSMIVEKRKTEARRSPIKKVTQMDEQFIKSQMKQSEAE